MPYIYAVDDHQTQNAHAVDEVGGGWLIPEGAFTDQVLADRLESLFAIPHMLESAGAAAKAAGKPDAASRLADMVIGMMPNTSDQREAA